jgi:hypothetical protein
MTRFVIDSTTTVLLDYLETRGLDNDSFANIREPLETTLYTYLSSRHLQTARIESFDPVADDTATEWFDITYERVSPDDCGHVEGGLSAADFERYREELSTRLQGLDPLPSATDYRILLGLVSENDYGQDPPSIDGWAETAPRTAPSATPDVDAGQQPDLTWYGHFR